MKLRWRYHGMILAILIALVIIASYVMDGSPFLPRAMFIVLVFGCYCFLNLVTVPFARKTSFAPFTGRSAIRIAFVILQSFLLAFIIAFAANLATYLGQPWKHNYAGFMLLAFFGYNDKPLSDLFLGYDRALTFLGIYCIYIIAREIIAWYVQKPNPHRSYHILVTNQVTLFAAMFLLVPVVIRSFDLVNNENYFFQSYLFFIPPVLIVSLYNLYWFFPSREKDIFSVKNLARLLSVTFLVTVIFIVMVAHENYIFFLVFWTLQFGLVTPVSWLIYQQRKDKLLELRGVENKLLQTNTDLQSLKAQINPHFLFNTLNSLYSTALREDSEATAEGIQKLGDMMRFMLHDNTRDFIPVSRELEYLSNYISLQKLRIPASSNIAISESIEVEHCHHEIAPMLLIPLVENAFKYGISLTEKSWIDIRLDCNNKGISLEVRNSIYPPAKGDAENGRSGIGLNNIKERLMLFYPGRHKFEYGKENNEFVARLSVQV